jgi:hypothetical protein
MVFIKSIVRTGLTRTTAPSMTYVKWTADLIPLLDTLVHALARAYQTNVRAMIAATLIFGRRQRGNRSPRHRFRSQSSQIRQTILAHAVKIAAREGK